jgi:hypothetical protein
MNGVTSSLLQYLTVERRIVCAYHHVISRGKKVDGLDEVVKWYGKVIYRRSNLAVGRGEARS